MSNQSSGICPLCGYGYLIDRVDLNRVNHNGVTADIPCHYSTCDNCKTDQAGSMQARKNKRAMQRFIDFVDEQKPVSDKFARMIHNGVICFYD